MADIRRPDVSNLLVETNDKFNKLINLLENNNRLLKSLDESIYEVLQKKD